MATQPVPVMTPVPAFPALSERAAGTYNASAYAFGNHMAVTFNGELLAVANNVKNNADEAQAKATAAANAASTAGTAASNAAAAAGVAGVARDEALTYAQAAGASAGIPTPVPSRVYATDAAGIPAWRDYSALSNGLPLEHVSAAAETAVAGRHYSLEAAGAVTVTLPAAPLDGDVVWITVANSRKDNQLARNGEQIMGLAEDMTLDLITSYQLRFITNSWRFM